MKSYFKNWLICLAAWVIICAAVYFGAAFINYDINAENWPENTRVFIGICIVGSFVFTIFLALTMNKIKDYQHKSKTTEAYFIGHCDDEDCDLGSFEYVCPHCYTSITDYNIWWERYNISEGKPVTFNCGNCGKQLTVHWNENKYEFMVY